MGTLPTLTAEGRLPVGRHEAPMSEVERLFVDEAPHTDQRRKLFRALELFAERCSELFPDSRLWINGGFVTHKIDAPLDVDVLIVVFGSPVVSAEEIFPLLTLQQVSAVVNRSRQVADRVQPFGGLVDGFIALAHDAAVLAYWDDWWSRVDNVPGRKGYVEVIL